MSSLVAPIESLGNVDARAFSALMAATGDVVLIVTEDGIVRDVTISDKELARELELGDPWLGRSLSSCVTVEGRGKIERLLGEAIAAQPARWVQVNLPTKRGGDIPIMYTAVAVGDAGRIIFIGRNLKAISALQQRLVDAQQSIERDYVRLRQIETRYRLLFDSISEPVAVVDPASRKPLEFNPAAAALFGGNPSQILKHPLPELFDAASAPAVEALLTVVRTAGRAEESAVRLSKGGREVTVSASLFRHDNAPLILVRIIPVKIGQVDAPPTPGPRTVMFDLIDHAPDGFVLTTSDGRILLSNPAFRDLAQIATPEQAEAGSLEQWLGRPGVDMGVLSATLRQRGAVSLFATTIRGEYGGVADVEISAATVSQGGKLFFGFIIRNVGRRLAADPRIGRDLPRSVDQLTELIGRVPLKDLVREATDMIERLCIQAALELTGDNRASAAELLGLSRQSLYVKLRRHGLGDLTGGDLSGGDLNVGDDDLDA